MAGGVDGFLKENRNYNEFSKDQKFEDIIDRTRTLRKKRVVKEGNAFRVTNMDLQPQ